MRYQNLGDGVAVYPADNPRARQAYNMRDGDEIVSFHYTFEGAVQAGERRRVWKLERAAFEAEQAEIVATPTAKRR